MMKLIYLSIFFFISTACSFDPNDSNSDNTRINLTENSKVFEGAYEDVFYNFNYKRAKDTLEYYLKKLKYDSSLFYAYHALTNAELGLNNFEKADSIHKLIDTTGLDRRENLEWMEDALEIATRFGNFDLAKEYIIQLHRHPGSKTPFWIQDNEYLFQMWLINSLMADCDSSKFYLKKYIISIKKLTQLRKLQRIDSSKISYFENQLNSDCPLMDSIGINLPNLIIYE